MSSSVVRNMPIEVRIYEAMVFMSGGGLIPLVTCLDMTITLLASLGPLVYMAEPCIAEMYSIWSVNCFSFANRVVFSLLKVRDDSSGRGVIIDKMDYSERVSSRNSVRVGPVGLETSMVESLYSGVKGGYRSLYGRGMCIPT